jgi:DNA-binding CsgD family transcriptional regulator
MVLLELGRLQEAEHWCDQLAHHAQRHPWFLIHGYNLHRRATLAWRKGNADQACTLFAELEELVTRWGLVDPSTIPWAGDAISAYLACSRPADARRVVDRLAAAHALPGLWPAVVASRGRAALAEQSGDIEQAEYHFAEAIRLQVDLRIPLCRAETLTMSGAFLARRGDVPRARRLLREALELAERHGAAWHTDLARAEWRRVGGRASQTRPGELTPRESAIAALAQAGRTNRQIAHQLFLSENTVETHLAHVYRKLGIRRRWELIAARR